VISLFGRDNLLYLVIIDPFQLLLYRTETMASRLAAVEHILAAVLQARPVLLTAIAIFLSFVGTSANDRPKPPSRSKLLCRRMLRNGLSGVNPPGQSSTCSNSALITFTEHFTVMPDSSKAGASEMATKNRELSTSFKSCSGRRCTSSDNSVR